MRTDMLFIDGELVDLDEDTQITLNIKSNLFTDLSKIVSNNTYTIKLPKTVRNQRIIEHADLPACDTDYPREYHQARYFRHGIEIIPDGKAVLVSCAGTLDIALTWGNIGLTEALTDGDKTLQDLEQTSPNQYYMTWKREVSAYGSDADFIVSDFDAGIRNYDTKNYVHPSVRVPWILERISHDSGISFEWPSSIKSGLIDRLLVPLTTKTGEREDESKGVTCHMKYRNGQVEGQGDYYVHAAITAQVQAEHVETAGQSNDIYWGLKMLHDNMVLRISGSFNFLYTSDEPSTPRFLAFTMSDGAAVEVFSANASDLEQTSGGNWNVSFNFNDVTSTIKVGDVVYFAFDGMGYVIDNATQGYGTWDVSLLFSVEEAVPQEEGVSNGLFPIIPNLPDIKWIDFLKAVMQMGGMFAVPDSGSTIRFVTADTIIAHKSQAKDWTKKVVATYLDNKPGTMTYTLDGFARHSYYRYKEDETVKGNYDASLLVDNATIETDADVVTLPFAGTDTKNRKAYIPLYDYSNSEDGVGELEDVEPRILFETNEGDLSKASFAELAWRELLGKYYNAYQTMIRRPVVIKEKIEISDVDLREIDVTVPVYLAQYGRYYAIISIKAEDTGICECELLQLEV